MKMLGGICGIPVILLLLCPSTNSGFTRSPCPEYFRYMRNEATGEIWARIEIPRAPKNIALHIRIGLSITAPLPTKYVGRLELASSKREAVKAVNQGRPLVYDLHFPLRNPIPMLLEITFNGKRYCMGSQASGPVVTTINLEHTLYPPRLMTLSENRPNLENADYFEIPQRRPATNFVPYEPEQDISPTFSSPAEDEDPTFMTVEEPTAKPDANDMRPSEPERFPEKPLPGPDSLRDYGKICGRVDSAGVNYLIANGDRTSPGQWPWLAAIFVARLQFQFQCAGSLVTDKHVITAAHCKNNNGINVPANAFLVSLGRYHLRKWRELGSQTHEVLNFRTHQDYGSSFSADADIAVITLRTRVQFTPKIQPVCLWNGPITLEIIVLLNGYVVGWGKDEHGQQHSQEPRVAVAPIVSQEDCLRSNIAFVPSTSNRTLCAGRRDGSGPCNGDSGSGLVLLDENTGRYHLRGIVSLSLLDKDRRSCDLSQYVVYVDAAKFSEWIDIQLNY